LDINIGERGNIQDVVLIANIVRQMAYRKIHSVHPVQIVLPLIIICLSKKGIKEMYKEYIKGFNCGKVLGFQLGRLTAFVEIHLIKPMIVMFMVGLTFGYIIGKIIR
jgi:hypothetical protein